MNIHEYAPYLFDIVAQGLAVALIAYASQSAILTENDSPIAVILFAATSILLFSLPRVGTNSRIPHLVILIFGLTTVLAYLFDVIHKDCNFGSLVGKPVDLPSDPLLCRKAAITWWLDLALFIWIKIVFVRNVWQSRRVVSEESTPPLEPERAPLLSD